MQQWLCNGSIWSFQKLRSNDSITRQNCTTTATQETTEFHWWLKKNGEEKKMQQLEKRDIIRNGRERNEKRKMWCYRPEILLEGVKWWHQAIAELLPSDGLLQTHDVHLDFIKEEGNCFCFKQKMNFESLVLSKELMSGIS